MEISRLTFALLLSPSSPLALIFYPSLLGIIVALVVERPLQSPAWRWWHSLALGQFFYFCVPLWVLVARSGEPPVSPTAVKALHLIFVASFPMALFWITKLTQPVDGHGRIRGAQGFIFLLMFAQQQVIAVFWFICWSIMSGSDVL